MNRILRNGLSSFVALVVLGLGACADPTTTPTSIIPEEETFKDPSSYLKFLAKIYAGMSVTGQQGPAGNKDIQTISDEGFSQYIRLYWQHQELPTDEAVLAWGDKPVQDFNSQTWSPSNDFVSAMFARIYLQIGWANKFLEQTTNSKLDERGNVSSELKAKIVQYRAEARFLRALAYWHGLDLYGNIPLVTSLSATPPSQATRAQVYDFVVSELQDIRAGTTGERLPAWAGGATYGRATREAATFLLARVYLNAEVYTGTAQYDLARQEAEAVIAGPFTLAPVYRNNFTADNNLSPEIIFPIVQDGIKSNSFGGTNFLIHASCGGSMSPAAYGVEGCWFGLRLKPEAYNRSKNDPRGSYFFTTGQSESIDTLTKFSDGIPAPKYTNLTSTGAPGQAAQYADTDYPMFRLGDAYLMYVEAVVRGAGGSAGQALTYVNALRQRAYGNTSGNVTSDSLTLQFVLDERGRELLWEGIRRTDLVRFGQFTGPTLWAWKGKVKSGVATPQYLDLYPIPDKQLSANNKLTQNPGY